MRMRAIAVLLVTTVAMLGTPIAPHASSAQAPTPAAPPAAAPARTPAPDMPRRSTAICAGDSLPDWAGAFGRWQMDHTQQTAVPAPATKLNYGNPRNIRAWITEWCSYPDRGD